MSRCLTRVAEILGLAESKRIMDRKTFIKDLQEAYLSEEYVEAINDETSKDFKSSVSWNQIMLTIHHVLLTETDKVANKAAKGNTVAILQSGCCDLMNKTVKLAISTRRMSLSCADFMAMIFQIFGNGAYQSYYDTYIGILSSVLANRIYRSAINLDQWREVLKLVQRIYFQSRNEVKGVVLDTARLAVQYGCSQSHLTLDVKKILPFLEKVYQGVARDRETKKKPVYKLTYAVCQQIGTESRIALCEFGEKILPAIITVEGCPEKYNMMLLLIRIHHPGGAVTTEDGAYACDWEQWRNIIRGIYASIVRDTKLDKMQPRFLELACEVYRLVMKDLSYILDATPTSADLDDMQPRKRRRLSVAVRKPVDMLLDNDLEVTWVSVQVLAILLRKYPDTLKLGEYEVFLKTVTELVTASLNNEKTTDSLCELCTVLVNAEKEHWHDAEKAEAVRICWEKIWDTILRALSMNQNEKFGHALLQSIIENRGAVNPNGILRLYLTNAIRWSSSSVKSLLTFCNCTPIPDELVFTGAASSSKPEGSTRISLLQWSLDIPSFKQLSQVPCLELANLLTALVVRSWHEHGFRDFRKFQELEYQRKMQSQASLRNDLFDDREEKYFNDIERCSLSLDFRQNDSELVDEESRKTIATKPRIFHVQEAVEHLIEALSSLVGDRAIVDELETTVTILTVIAKVLSNFGEFNIGTESQTSKLVNLFTQRFKKVCSFLEKNPNSFKFDYLVRVIEALECLYTTRYNREVAQIVSRLSSMDFLIFIFNLPEDHGDSDDEDNENSQSFNNIHGNHSRKVSDKYSNVSIERSRGCRIRNSAYKILTYFCCTPIDDKILDAQMRVLRNLMKISLYENTSNSDLQCALEVLKTYGMSGQLLESGEESLGIANNFIQQLLQSRLKEETAVRGILNVLPHFLEASKRFNREIQKILEILSTINKRLMKKSYGPLVLGDFVKCIAAIVRTNPFLTWRPGSSVESSPIIDVLVDYIDNPFYLVRIEVVRALYDVFASKDLQVPTKANFFRKIESAIPELFSTEEISNNCEKMDEYRTRTLTAVHIYATVLRANKYLSSRALYSMITLSVLRDVKIKTIKRALLYVTKTEEDQRCLIELHLHDLLSRWFEDNYPLQLFPWTLIHCDSQEDFSRRYIDTLLSIKLQRCEFQQLVTLCNNLDVSFAQTVEDCFPTIMTQLVSMIVQDSSEAGGPKRVAYAKEMYARLRRNTGEFEGVKSFDVLLKEKLSDVLIHLVQRLRDDEHFFEMFSGRVFLPAINPPNLTVETIDRCLGFLEKILSVEEECLVEYLVTRCPNILQRVYETLFCNINAISWPDNKLQAFHQYRYFGTIVLRELQKPYFDPMSLYIVRDTSYSLLSVTKDKTLAVMACDYFYEFLRNSMPNRSSEIKEVLSFVVSTLVPLAQSSPDHGATKILEFLIIEQKEWLGDAIEKLDSFPNVESFKAIQRVHESLKYGGTKSYSLEDEIEHFLNATNVKTLSCSHEGLVHVKNQLATRKEELRDMYRRLEGLRGFAEDCASSTLHKLIYKLVQLTRSCDTNISLEAAKCLGELGPADLTTMILNAENVYAKEDDDKIAMLTFRVTSQLIDYLVDNNTNLRRACSAALYEIFSTPWGHDLARDTGPRDDRTYRYIYPFVNRSKSSRMSRGFRIDHGNWQSCIDPTYDLWTPAARNTHDKWIIDLTCKLLDCFVNLYTPCLKPVCRESVEFCEILLPRLVNLVRSIDSQYVNDVCLCINRFFLRVYEALGEADISMTISETPVKHGDASLSHECVRSMINVVNFMRIQTSDNAPLCLDYLYIAKAAQYCSAYFTSVLYAELWCQYLLQDSRLLQDKVPGSWISAIDCICESKPEPGKLLQSIVREAYLHIGDPDSIHGCGSAHLIDSSYRVQHYVHMRQWDKVMLAQDVEMCSGNASTRGILYALQQSGLQSLMGRVISTINKEQENVDDFMYEAAWRLADWNIADHRRSNENLDASTCPIGQNVNINDYHSSHYRALKCLRDADYLGLKTYLDDARTSLIVSLRKISLECSRTVYPILSQLRMLREIEDFASIVADSSGEALAKWRQDNCLAGHDFPWIEPILSQRLVMYRTAERTSNFTNTALIETHLEMAEIAEKQGYLPIAARALDALSRLDLSSSARDELTYQEAFLAWKRNDQDIGRYLVRNLIKKTNLSPGLRAKALSVYGNWMAVTKSENPQAVIEKYYKESIKTSFSIVNKSSRETKNLTEAQADLAQFADAQYQQIVEFMQSPQYESLHECTKLKSDGSDKSMAGRNKDVNKAIDIYHKQMTNDATELESLQREKEKYLVLAAKYYLMTLQSSDEHDLLLFRLVSLWLDNTYSENLNQILAEQLQTVASYKFIVLLPQLAPHMSNSINVFTTKIHDLMKRCAEDHPHHTLPVLLALKNTHKDNEFKPSDSGTQQRRNEAGYIEPRVFAADALISKLMASPIKTIIREMNDLSHALVALAYFNVTEAQARKKNAAHVIPRTQPITKIRNYANTYVPTLTVPVKPGRNYNDVIGVSEYVANFDLPGGVNAPKKVVCVGTDGIRRTQLVKGQDDLRQDAVMQQVCTVMNDMLRTSKETKKRKLHIRTYKIVPLSRRSGILEWCENTLPISHVLCDIDGKRGMHAKYYPGDWSVAKCRAKLHAVDRSPIKIKLETFLECCRNLHPAFHHFFMEKYPSAETWFERRLAYVRSVATTSMVGYMLGLGDRHFSNILIDQTTAEVIHIDFGIAFAQGKVLPIPETVPFRLTRDMEVAMGICGVEGVMRRSCEETVAVLRDRRKILITLLQVLLYDPLFSWAITPVISDTIENQSARRPSGRFADDRGMKKTNKVAERALLRIEQKLQGTEDGISSSISGQVERLIQQARDPINLSRLYSGWQAYL